MDRDFHSFLYYSVVLGKLIMEVFKIAQFSGGSNKKGLVVAGDIDSGNGKLGRT